ncbi:Methionine--tRNA ligase [Gossypium australe]|uniref:Methionine--tRNA ligase n=1 Tax=Gossypium australe TaxID=47621 RepID=A0A5B6VSH9_9ROSI|nr:Methionine--tRNA ligase [Gossypium australe]
MTNWSSLRGHRDIVMIPTPGAPNGADGQPSADHYQENSSGSMLTGRKKRNQKDTGKGKGIKKQRLPRLTGESSNLGKESLEEHKTVEQSWKNLTDQINRRMTTLINLTSIGAKTMTKIFCLFLSHLLCDMKVKGKYWDWLRNCPKVLATVSQIEEKWPLLSNLQKIKENMKKIMAEFRAGSLMEVEAKQKLNELKKELYHIDLEQQAR